MRAIQWNRPVWITVGRNKTKTSFYNQMSAINCLYQCVIVERRQPWLKPLFFKTGISRDSDCYLILLTMKVYNWLTLSTYFMEKDSCFDFVAGKICFIEHFSNSNSYYKLSNISKYWQSGRLATMTVRYCKPEQKASWSAYLNTKCKVLQSCFL